MATQDTTDEPFEFCCPNCSAQLSFDDTGEPVVINEPELPRGSTRTHKGLVVVDADPEWKEKDYLRNQQAKPVSSALKPPTSFTKIVEEIELPNESEAEPQDPFVLEASIKDLQDKGIF